MRIRQPHNLPLLSFVRSTSELFTTFALKDGDRRERHESGVLRLSIRVSSALPLSRHHKIEKRLIPVGNHVKLKRSRNGLKFLPCG
jgi:hypothetical protein